MGNGLSCRETWRRDWQCHLRRNPTLGEGVPVKSIRQGVAWNGAWTGVGDRNEDPDGLGGGLHDGLDKIGRTGVAGAGDIPLGGTCVGTLERPGIGIRGGWNDGDASSRHDSKMSRRLVMALTWEMLVGSDAPVRVPATTCEGHE